ncbi:MAG: epoxyqueuosine reductase QueH, partial [Candidatus Cloacimonadaceae bacterium]|nr:epoxyqueuosine reductase QueH [Candidatus Cloacimonadaceae bacterium]
MTETKLLVHICCAPCFIAPYYDLIAKGMDVTGFWFNPNIHPYTEYKLRLQAVKDFAAAQSIPLIYKDDYLLNEFLQMAASDISKRC